MKVLIACERSGIVRDAFLASGHDALSCDLAPTEQPGPHYQGSVIDILGDGWDMMIAHPPCTYLSNAGAKHLYRGKTLNLDRYAMGLEAREFFMMLLNAPIPMVAVENPGPSRVFELPTPTQIIQPWEFGHPFTKRTLLWLRGLPPLMPTKIMETRQSSRVAGNWFNAGGKDRQQRRAQTFPGIAEAMADQWGDFARFHLTTKQTKIYNDSKE